jgi:predicted  nucleic acid-binding Zn-ribbon protein
LRRGLAIYTILLLLVATWLPLVTAEDSTDHGFTQELGDELAAFGEGYVENLVLYSGAGVNLAWGPSFNGNSTLMDARLAELESVSGGSMPANMTPILLPFDEADPGFSGPAPLDHSAPWMWNSSDPSLMVDLGDLGYTLKAEAMMADETAEGLLMVLAATEAISFAIMNLGTNGSDFVPLNLSDPTMTDSNMTNGYWLPYDRVEGQLNATYDPPAWEGLSSSSGVKFNGVFELMDGITSLYSALSDLDIEGVGKAFPEGTMDGIKAVHNAIYWNMIGYREDPTMWGPGPYSVADMGMFYLVMDDIVDARSGDPVGFHAASVVADMAYHLPDLLSNDGSLPESYIVSDTDYTPSGGVGSGAVHAIMVKALLHANARYSGFQFGAAAEASMAYMDANFWEPEMSLWNDKSGPASTYYSAVNILAIDTYATAVDLGANELAKYRIPAIWEGMVAAGLQLTETDTTGENYTASENDTDMDGIPKHSMSWGEGRENGVAPVLARSAIYDGEGNWTLSDDGVVSTFALMIAAQVLMTLDGEWFTVMGEPAYSEEYAYRLLHWTDAEFMAWWDAQDAEIADLMEEIEELQNATGNVSKIIDELKADIADLEEELAALTLDFNDTFENETVLRNQTIWLREKLEETNETVDDLNREIEILESKVTRLEEDLVFRDENVTDLEVELRAERNNVTKLQWEMDNASAALAQAELDLAAAQRERDSTKEDLEDAEGRTFITALIALFAGMVIVVVILRVLDKL